MKKSKKIGFIVCWFGSFPDYFNIWLQTCSYNKEFDFILFTDGTIENKLPDNVHSYFFTLDEFRKRAQEKISAKISIEKPYRVCDFRPMYGILFENELRGYDFWGYCDIDIVFGKIINFVNMTVLDKYDAIFNGGHFTLVRNCKYMNQLYKKSGGLFDYKKVVSIDALYAFDEKTGIQRISKKNNVNAKYSVSYIETTIGSSQLRSFYDSNNPSFQAFYWDQGELYRVKYEGGEIRYQKYAYIHLQKRKYGLLDSPEHLKERFWITPRGFKKMLSVPPSAPDVIEINPPVDKNMLKKENLVYCKRKLREILSRNVFQIYVRARQEIDGINRYTQGSKEQKWEKY